MLLTTFAALALSLIAGHVESAGSVCPTTQCGANQIRNPTTCQCQCNVGKVLQNGQCVCPTTACGANQVRNFTTCQCHGNAERVHQNGQCSCPTGSIQVINVPFCLCQCFGGRVLLNGVCECPTVACGENQIINPTTCQCQDNAERVHQNEQCLCPTGSNQIKNATICQCQCNAGKVLRNGECVCSNVCLGRGIQNAENCACTCINPNMIYSQTSGCVCSTSACGENQVRNPTTCQCECKIGTFNENGQCGQVESAGSECTTKCPAYSIQTENCACRCGERRYYKSGQCQCILPCGEGFKQDPETCICLHDNQSKNDSCETACPAYSDRSIEPACGCKCKPGRRFIEGKCWCLRSCPKDTVHDQETCGCFDENTYLRRRGLYKCNRQCPLYFVQNKNCGCECEMSRYYSDGQCKCDIICPQRLVLNEERCYCYYKGPEPSYKRVCSESCPKGLTQNTNCGCYNLTRVVIDRGMPWDCKEPCPHKHKKTTIANNTCYCTSNIALNFVDLGVYMDCSNSPPCPSRKTRNNFLCECNWLDELTRLPIRSSYQQTIFTSY